MRWVPRRACPSRTTIIDRWRHGRRSDLRPITRISSTNDHASRERAAAMKPDAADRGSDHRAISPWLNNLRTRPDACRIAGPSRTRRRQAEFRSRNHPPAKRRGHASTIGHDDVHHRPGHPRQEMINPHGHHSGPRLDAAYGPQQPADAPGTSSGTRRPGAVPSPAACTPRGTACVSWTMRQFVISARPDDTNRASSLLNRRTRLAAARTNTGLHRLRPAHHGAT